MAKSSFFLPSKLLRDLVQCTSICHHDISIPQFCWKLFHGNILRKQQKNEFPPKPEPMRTLSRVPLEHSWEGRKAWDCEVGLGGEEDAVFVTTRGWVNFHRNFY